MVFQATNWTGSLTGCLRAISIPHSIFNGGDGACDVRLKHPVHFSWGADNLKYYATPKYELNKPLGTGTKMTRFAEIVFTQDVPGLYKGLGKFPVLYWRSSESLIIFIIRPTWQTLQQTTLEKNKVNYDSWCVWHCSSGAYRTECTGKIPFGLCHHSTLYYQLCPVPFVFTMQDMGKCRCREADYSLYCDSLCHAVLNQNLWS